MAEQALVVSFMFTACFAAGWTLVSSDCIFDSLDHSKAAQAKLVYEGDTVNNRDRRSVKTAFENIRIHVHYYDLEELMENEKERVRSTIKKTVAKAQDIFSG